MRAQFRLEPLRLGRSQVKRLEKTVESDDVRQFVVKISQADRHAPATAGPELLSHANVPTQIVFRFQPEIVPENFVLTAGRTESRRDAGMQRCVYLVDLVTPSEAISPDPAELVEVIEAPADDKD